MPEQTSSKDFIEHLRSIHFALIAISTAVLILAVAKRQSEIVTAHSQIREIIDLQHRLRNDWLEQALRSNEHAGTVRTLDLVLNLKGVNTKFDPVSVHAQFNEPNSFVELSPLPEVTHRTEPAPELEPLSSWTTVPKSVSEFQAFWDRLNSGAVVKTAEIPRLCFLRLGSETFQAYRSDQCSVYDSAAKSSLPILTLNLSLHREGEEFRQIMVERGLKPADFGYSGGISLPGAIDQLIIEMPVSSYQTHSFNAQATLIKEFSEPNWHQGSFSDVFRELATITSEYQNADLQTAEKIIAAEEKRAGESLDALGVKFPAETAIRWGLGPILIVLVQLYFFAHLFELKHRGYAVAGDWEVPWVGVYSTKPARLIMIVSTLFLPILAVFVTCIKGLTISGFEWYSWAILAVSAMSSLTLSVLTGRLLPTRKALIPEKSEGNAV